MSREELWTQSVRHWASLRSPLKLEKHPLVRAHLWNRGTGALNNIHSEITCGVPVDWRLGNFNNVTLYIPPRSLTPKSLLSTAQSQKCMAKHVPFPSLYHTGRQVQQMCEVWGNPATSRPWPAEERPPSLATAVLTQREGITLQEGPLQSSAAQGTPEFGMQPGMAQNTARHPCQEMEDLWLWMAKSR